MLADLISNYGLAATMGHAVPHAGGTWKGIVLQGFQAFVPPCHQFCVMTANGNG